jgi:hypothetical protein
MQSKTSRGAWRWTATLTALLAISPIISHADEDAVFSVNVVGFQKMELPIDGRFRFASMPFNAGDSTLLDIFGTNSLRRSAFLSAADKVILYDNSEGTYQRWAQRPDGLFYKANNATEWGAQQSGNPVITRGQGFWLASASGTQTNIITLVGDVVMNPTSLIDLAAGFQIVAYPFSSDFNLEETAGLTNSGAAASAFLSLTDRLSLYDPETGTYQRYALFTDGKWYKANDASEWGQKIPATQTLPAGSAFWYEAKNAFSWSENNPYNELFED